MSRSIPSLDGLRAFSITLVILAHMAWHLPPAIRDNSLFRLGIGNGAHGVAVFFVISGYLITMLLLKELDKDGMVSLKRFYLRRSFRIFPPFYVFMGVMGLLWIARVIPQDPRSFAAAVTYTFAWFPGVHGYFIFHSWSLSVEEQFYLLWPLAFVIWPNRKRLTGIAVTVTVAMPILRVALYFAAPGLRGHEGFMVQGWIDTISLGCLLAILPLHKVQRYLNGWLAGCMLVIALYGVPLLLSALPRRVASFLSLLAVPTVTAFCIGGVLLYVVQHPDGLAGRLLNNPVIRHVGVLSYSLYLWQQLFLGRELAMLPYGLIFLVLTAELSFWLVERPSLRLRGMLESTRPPAFSVTSSMLCETSVTAKRSPSA